ncbi:hypothetical protein IAR50_007321 [Cryptococcus sp. DSM 104548]
MSDNSRPPATRDEEPHPIYSFLDDSSSEEEAITFSIEANIIQYDPSSTNGQGPTYNRHTSLEERSGPMVDGPELDSTIGNPLNPSTRGALTAGPSSFGNTQHPFDPSYYHTVDDWGEIEAGRPPRPLSPPVLSVGSFQADRGTGRPHEAYSFVLLMSDQNGMPVLSELQLRGPTRESFRRRDEWIAEIERFGGPPPEGSGSRISLDEAIAHSVESVDDDRRTAVRQMVISSLERSWQSGERSFNFALDDSA